MQPISHITSVSPKRLWAARITSAVVLMFLLFDGIAKLMKVPQVVEATAQLGYPEHSILTIGILLLVCTVVYAIPRTAVLGAILLTGYLGGAVAANLRVSHPVFETVFPILFGALVWTGIFLREGRLSTVIPLRK